MIPGPDIIRKCSHCGGLIKQHSIMSGNTYGARFWTDGKVDAPMLPDQPWLVKCGQCNALVWIDEQRKAGEIYWDRPPTKSDAKFKSAVSTMDPSFEDYLTVLAEPISDARKENYIRRRIWWAGNDRRRKRGKAVPMSDQEVENLRAYIACLNEIDEDERLMKAEAFRELGMFTEAKELLSGAFSEDVEYVATFVKKLADKRVAAVKEIK